MKITYILLLAIMLIASTSAFRVKTDTDSRPYGLNRYALPSQYRICNKTNFLYSLDFHTSFYSSLNFQKIYLF